jgi:hypothetical protein
LHFAKQPGSLEAFIDQKSTLKIVSPTSPFNLKVPLNETSNGSHIVTVNWNSKLGPIAVNSMRVRINGFVPHFNKQKK